MMSSCLNGLRQWKVGLAEQVVDTAFTQLLIQELTAPVKCS